MLGFVTEELGINNIGLPLQFWNWVNVEKMVKKVGELQLLEVD